MNIFDFDIEFESDERSSKNCYFFTLTFDYYYTISI